MNRISGWPALSGTPALLEELDQLGLLPNALELETQGFTVVPPEKVRTAGSSRTGSATPSFGWLRIDSTRTSSG